MNCAAVILELSNYIDGEVDIVMRRQLELHLAGCIDCTMILKQTRTTIELFVRCESIELPADVRSRLHEALRQKMADPRA